MIYWIIGGIIVLLVVMHQVGANINKHFRQELRKRNVPDQYHLNIVNRIQKEFKQNRYFKGDFKQYLKAYIWAIDYQLCFREQEAFDDDECWDCDFLNPLNDAFDWMRRHSAVDGLRITMMTTPRAHYLMYKRD